MKPSVRVIVPAVVLFALSVGRIPAAPAASACGSPDLWIQNGAPTTQDGIAIVYKGQLVTVKGTGWASCAEPQSGGCSRTSGPPPATGIDVMVVRAAPHRASTPPSSWRPTSRVLGSWTTDADTLYQVVLANVSMPPRSGHYLLMATSPDEPRRRTFGWITVL